MARRIGTRFRFRAAGEGAVGHGEYVELISIDFGSLETVVKVLHYPSQGQLVGDPRRDIQYANQLNEALEPLNAKLAELAGDTE